MVSESLLLSSPGSGDSKKHTIVKKVSLEQKQDVCRGRQKKRILTPPIINKENLTGNCKIYEFKKKKVPKGDRCTKVRCNRGSVHSQL